MAAGDLGMIVTASQGNTIPPNTQWCLDNECFKGDKFKPSAFLRALERRTEEEQDRCLFVVAPDVVADAQATLERSTYWLPLIKHEYDLPVAFVGQDGCEHGHIPWDTFDAWFIGGTTDWKLSAESYRLAQIAKSKGKWVHMGRVNSRKRCRIAASWGCDSVDGTYLTFGPKQNLPKLLSWMSEINGQPTLGLE